LYHQTTKVQKIVTYIQKISVLLCASSAVRCDTKENYTEDPEKTQRFTEKNKTRLAYFGNFYINLRL